MNIKKVSNLACPIDGARLVSREKQLICENGHTFDIARQGYVNLLPVQHKRAKHPGDSKEMVSARSRFLDSGVYEPIVKKLSEVTLLQVTDADEVCIMDAGCGEGYYLDAVFHYLKEKDINCGISFMGLDISKDAIAVSAKRNKLISWIVGTNRHPPVDDASVDVIICVFGFQSFEGFHKVLKPGGKLILVEPGPDHLQELRKIIYTEVKKSDPQDLAYAKKAGFVLTDSQQLQFNTVLTNNQKISDLLVMTPHFYRATKEGREAANKLQQLDLTIDIVFRILVKNK